MLESISPATTSPNNAVVKTNTNPNFMAKNNALERIPQGDILEKKKHTGAKIALGSAVALGIGVAADFIFAKGKHVKSLSEKFLGTCGDIMCEIESRIKGPQPLSQRAYKRILKKNVDNLTAHDISDLLSKYFKDKDTSALKKVITELKLELPKTNKSTVSVIQRIKRLDNRLSNTMLDFLSTEAEFCKKNFRSMKASEVADILEPYVERANIGAVTDSWLRLKLFLANPKNKDATFDKIAPEFFNSELELPFHNFVGATKELAKRYKIFT